MEMKTKDIYKGVEERTLLVDLHPYSISENLYLAFNIL